MECFLIRFANHKCDLSSFQKCNYRSSHMQTNSQSYDFIQKLVYFDFCQHGVEVFCPIMFNETLGLQFISSNEFVTNSTNS